MSIAMQTTNSQSSSRTYNLSSFGSIAVVRSVIWPEHLSRINGIAAEMAMKMLFRNIYSAETLLTVEGLYSEQVPSFMLSGG
jgi:hypothetical protein